MNNYDEDISENKFFVNLQNHSPELYKTAADNRWIICVPRGGSSKYMYTELDFQNHILIPTPDAKRFKTISSKELIIQNSAITTGIGFDAVRIVQILFEETFFNDNDESYRVLCISAALEGGLDYSENPANITLHSMDDCTEILWGHTENRRTKRQLNQIISLFNKSYDCLKGETIIHYVDAANALFTRAMQIVLKDNFIKRTARHNKMYMDNIKIAVETYVMHGIFRKIFDGISACLASKDSQLNKITRNLSQLQLRDLGVYSEFSENIPRARKELSSLPRYSTPLGKMYCLRRVVMALMQPPRKRSVSSEAHESPAITTDDILPMLVFMVIKSEVANWFAHLTYMNYFRFSKSNNDDEFGYYTASIEAALQHILSGKVDETASENISVEKLIMGSITDSDRHRSKSQSADHLLLSSGEHSSVDRLFEYVKDGDVMSVRSLIRKNRQESDDAKYHLCHPLCSCDKCEQLMSKSRSDLEAVTAFSRDDRGFTALHVAALYGHAEIIEILVESGGVVDATDYHGSTPLHIACQKGHQNVTLMLLDKKADINAADNDGNTPLHLCTSNGHEDCVKALVYYDLAESKLDVNAANDFGDTSLHLAARWGYLNVIEILLENGATVEARNRRKLTPVHCAHNVKISNLLKKAARPYAIEGLETQLMAKNDTNISPSVSPAVTPDTPKRRSSSFTIAAEVLRTGSPLDTKIQKLLRSVIDDDVEMVKYHLGWTGDSDDEDSNLDLSQHKLCHPLCQCDKCSPLQKMRATVDGALNVDACNSEGFTALHIAARHGHQFLVTLLLKRGATVNVKTSQQGCTPLHFASQYNKTKVVRLLIKHGAKINIKDVRGNSPLHFACINNCINVVKYLIQHDSSINQANMKGNTPLHEAARWNYYSLVQLLIMEGAPVLCRNKQQLTPMQLAQNDEIVALLDQALIEEENTVTTKNRQKYKIPVDRNSIERSTVHGSLAKRMSMRDLFAAFEDKDLKKLETIAESVKIHQRGTLRRTSTKDRSAPCLDGTVILQFAIQNFDTSTLRPTKTIDRSSLAPLAKVCELPSVQSSCKNVIMEQEMQDVNEDMEEVQASPSDSQTESYILVPDVQHIDETVPSENLKIHSCLSTAEASAVVTNSCDTSKLKEAHHLAKNASDLTHGNDANIDTETHHLVNEGLSHRVLYRKDSSGGNLIIAQSQEKISPEIGLPYTLSKLSTNHAEPVSVETFTSVNGDRSN